VLCYPLSTKVKSRACNGAWRNGSRIDSKNMKAELSKRRLGRPALHNDKNGRPAPVRADRDRPLRWFFEAVSRPDLDDALLLSGDDRFYRLHDALHDDAYRRTSPGTLCRKFGISWVDLIDLWSKYTAGLGRIEIANHLPEIMNEVAEDSLSRQKACPSCDGASYAVDGDEQRSCAMCDGAGSVRIPGDAHARSLLFKIVRPLNHKAPGSLI
jgi:hypothetical protein